MYKILIIDDDEAFAESLGTRIKRLGHEVVYARDGISGGAMIRRTKPDLLILDFRMPAGDGALTLQRFQLNEESRNIPVILASAIPTKEIRKGFMTNPAGLPANKFRYLAKPIDPVQLAKALADLLPGSTSQ